VSLKHDRTDGTPNRHCVNAEEYFEDEYFGIFLQCQSITICRGIELEQSTYHLSMFQC